MGKDCSDYFQSDTAINILRSGNEREKGAIYNCLDKIYKANFMGAVIFKNGKLNPETQAILAGTAFNDVWLSIIKTSANKDFVFNGETIIPYFRKAFFTNFAGKLGNELKRIAFEKDYLDEAKNAQQAEEKYKYHLHEIKEKFKAVSDKCKALITLRYIEKRDIEYIHQRFPEIQKEYITKEISRCLKNLGLSNNPDNE